jgi:predicted 3-demethylubiquinone-9 3-methyltransferase (glyoxalase superfamily)
MTATAQKVAAPTGGEQIQPRAQKITTFLWFDNNAEEAVNFYVSIFKNSKILNTVRNGEAGPGPNDSVLTIAFELDGQEFAALNGGPQFKFTEAISQVVHCQTQEEVDYFWEKLSAGGQIIECGWLKDKFGLSWQIVPDLLLELLQDSDGEKSQRVMKAMMKMKKLDIAVLKEAASSQ